jgi:hypothetical protein
MEQRDQSHDHGAEARTDEDAEPRGTEVSDPLAETTALPHNINVAAARAAQAAVGDGFGDGFGDDRGDDFGSGSGPGPARADGPASRGPRRWLITAGVAVSALALAGTAAAIATHGSHGKSGDTTENTAAAHTTDSPAPSVPLQNTGSTDGAAPGAGTSSDDRSSSSSAPSSAPASPKQPLSTPKATPKTSAATTPAGSGQEGGDCENTSHSTEQDETTNFSGMSNGTRAAFLAAQTAAKARNLSFVLNSGYRSAAYQERIFDCWVKQLGSPEAARKYALPANESAHVMGYAMDIAPPPAASWLESTKGEFGLCRRYADETWHFEYQAAYKTKGCPALLPHP